jgi:hypothetical protein
MRGSALSQRVLRRGFASGPPANPLVDVFINERKVSVKPGTTILNACAEAGVEIPRFCFHERKCLAREEKKSCCALPMARG